MSRKKTLLKGTFILTVTGLITRFMGFFFRIFMSHIVGENGMGLYQLIFPVYALGFSITSAGIELALSRCVSRYYALNNKKRAREMLYTSLIITLTFSCILTLLLQHSSEMIAVHFLHNHDTFELLLMLSYVFPFAAVHSCIVGYYLGVKQTLPSAVSQFIEQSFRILSIYLIYKLSNILFFEFRIIFAVLGIIIGEFASSLYCIKKISNNTNRHFFPGISLKTFISCSKELLTLSFPVTLSRVLLNVLQSIEATRIPLSLIAFGYSSNKSLSIYGVLTGMALPCILFPSAITSAISTMLLPTVAEIQALQNRTALLKIIQKTISACTFLGSLCCITFLLSGKFAGKMLFNSSLAGEFILILAWMCPFLYTNNTLISIINGIGKTTVTFVLNACSLFIRILSVVFLIPLNGIYGYLIGLLFSQIFIFFSCIIYLYKKFKAEAS